jgi:hypothetical protein
MYSVAWRVALFIGDRSPEAVAEASSAERGSGARAASWLFAPAILALDLCD